MQSCNTISNGSIRIIHIQEEVDRQKKRTCILSEAWKDISERKKKKHWENIKRKTN